jgi:hypothetical protein
MVSVTEVKRDKQTGDWRVEGLEESKFQTLRELLKHMALIL